MSEIDPFKLGSLILLGLLGVFLWLYFRRQRRPLPSFPERVKELKLPESHFINIDGFEVRYTQKGQGPDLLLIHGIGASLYCWRYLIDQLSHSFRVTSLDLPGFGQSSKQPEASYSLDAQTERLQKFLSALHIKRCHVIGSSMGATLSLWLAKQSPQTVTDVVCLAPAANPILVPIPLRHWAWVSRALSLGVSRFVISAILRRVVRDPNLVTPEAVNEYYQPYNKDPLAIRSFMLATETISDRRLPKGFATIQQPALVLWGHNDKMVSERMIDQVCKHLRHVTCYKHEFAGHHLQEDDPEWVITKVVQFFGAHEN